MDNKFGFGRVIENIATMKKVLPVQIANQARNFFMDSFNAQGWEDNGLHKWPEVQRRIPGTKAYKYPKTKGLSRRTSAILVRSGTLRRAVGMSIKRSTMDQVLLSVAVPYAEYQNDGTKTIPKREFMGHSATLERMQEAKIDESISNIFNK